MPQPRKRLDSNQALKKQPYMIFRALRELENRRSLAYICAAPNVSGIPAGVALLNHLESVLQIALIEIHAPPGEVTRYLHILSTAKVEAIQSIQTRKPLRSVVITNLLKAHTKAFNSLKGTNHKLQINNEEWIRAVQCTVAIWGNTPPAR